MGQGTGAGTGAQRRKQMRCVFATDAFRYSFGLNGALDTCFRVLGMIIVSLLRGEKIAETKPAPSWQMQQTVQMWNQGAKVLLNNSLYLTNS
jgi:hypothetical protein